MKKLQFAAALMCAFFVLGYGTTKTVLLSDSTFSEANQSITCTDVIMRTYSHAGLDSVDSEFTGTKTLSAVYLKSYDAAGNDTSQIYGIKVGTNINYYYARNVYAYDSLNRRISDSYYHQTSGPKQALLSVDKMYYGNNGKESVDSVFDPTGKLLNYSVYTYNDTGNTVINYDTNSTELAAYIVHETNGVPTDRSILDKSNKETGYIDYTYGNITVPVRYFTSSNTHQSGVSAIKISNSGRSSTVSFAMSSSANVKVRLFDISGKLVKTLASGTLSEGTYSFGINSLVPGNSYVLRIYGDKFNVSRQFSIN